MLETVVVKVIKSTGIAVSLRTGSCQQSTWNNHSHVTFFSQSPSHSNCKCFHLSWTSCHSPSVCVVLFYFITVKGIVIRMGHVCQYHFLCIWCIPYFCKQKSRARLSYLKIDDGQRVAFRCTRNTNFCCSTRPPFHVKLFYRCCWLRCALLAQRQLKYWQFVVASRELERDQ